MSAIKRVIEGKETIRQVSLDIGIPEPTTVGDWVDGFSCAKIGVQTGGVLCEFFAFQMVGCAIQFFIAFGSYSNLKTNALIRLSRHFFVAFRGILTHFKKNLEYTYKRQGTIIIK